MSNRYKGGIISATPPTTSGPYENGAASGVWTLEQQMQVIAAGTWPLAGNVPLYVEDVFSTYLYTGTGAAQTITNGIDLSGKGGLTWIKSRSSGSEYHVLQDTVRGRGNVLSSNTSDQSFSSSAGESITTYNSTGFSLGTNRSATQAVNTNSATYVSWTFREQAKFFDVVTFTGDGRTSGSATINHNLGATPAVIIIKQVNDTGNWQYGTNFGSSNWLSLFLNLTDAGTTTTYANNDWFAAQPTSTTFTVGFPYYGSGQQYVAYLFASNAGGFGLTGTDNVISCGSYTGNGSADGPTVSLGYEPQWILVKNTTSAADWFLFDTMRGLPVGSGDVLLYANDSSGEATGYNWIDVNATGFKLTATYYGINTSGANYIYIAIRRGPMKVPTVGTSVFSPIAYTGNSTSNTTVQNLTTNFSGDTAFIQQRSSGNNPLVFDKLRGRTQGLYTSLTLAEEDINAFRAGQSVGFNNTQTVLTGQFTAQGNYNYSGNTFVGWNFQRAPGFFDEVCDTGTGSTHTIAHNLGVVPEFIIRKSRSQSSTAWYCYVASEGASRRGFLNQNFAWGGPDNSIWGGTTPTNTVFTVGADGNINNNASTYVTYLFATLAGVSKVGSYTGTATTLQIDCGFTAGSRFVLIKRTDSTGDWYVWDSARGIVAGNDPYLLLNSTAAEVTNTDYVDTYNAGFEISSTAPAAINASGGTFIFLAIA